MIIGDSKLPIRMTGHMGAEIKLGQKSQYTNSTSIMPNIVRGNTNVPSMMIGDKCAQMILDDLANAG